MWPLMRDFPVRRGVLDGSERNARLRLPEGFWHAAAMTSPHGLCGSFRGTMMFNFGVAIVREQHTAESQGAGR
jgi:hypothetical protein